MQVKTLDVPRLMATVIKTSYSKRVRAKLRVMNQRAAMYKKAIEFRKGVEA